MEGWDCAILQAPSNPTCPFADDYKIDSEQILILPPPARKRKSNFQSSFVTQERYILPQKEEEVLSDPLLPQGKLRTAAVPYFATECGFMHNFFASQEQVRGTDEQPAGRQDREQCANKFFLNTILDQETEVLRELML